MSTYCNPAQTTEADIISCHHGLQGDNVASLLSILKLPGPSPRLVSLSSALLGSLQADRAQTNRCSAHTKEKEEEK